ncbi:MAG: hypothetical protein AAF530_25065 [Pseudomonadota bacterium]
MERTTSNKATPLGAFGRIAVASIFALIGMLGVSAEVSAQSAAAQTRCAPHAEMASKLSDRYSESLVAIGFADSGRLIEVFSSPDGKTWTILTTAPGGTACIAATGQDWEARKTELTGPEA